MILDTSAVLAILFGEPGWEDLTDRILASETRLIGAPTVAEAMIVLDSRLGTAGVTLLERFLQEYQVQEVPFDADHARLAGLTYARYGKGRHLAGLNFGDCMSYAVAAKASDSLLYVGNDFSQTDLA
jgi:ribonuclease VapC